MSDVSLQPPPSKLLVAEDDPLIRETLQDLLVMAGFEIAQPFARCEQQGDQKVLAQQFDPLQQQTVPGS